jgi:pimeloyl-ACP methyl ester carboxylesterase
MAANKWALPIGIALVVALLPVMPANSGPSGSAAAQSCGKQSWTAGTVDICNGTVIYRDYVYDDYGADTADPTPPTTGLMTRPAGDKRYPEGQENTADIIDLKVAVDGASLTVAFELGALYNADSTIAALAIDTDNDESTGGGEWEGLGISSSGWEELHKFDTGDPKTNLIEGSVPLPSGDRWRLQAVTAQADGTVMNVAFRGPDEETATGTWWDDKQAAALGSGDISQFGYEVDAADLTTGARKPAEAVSGYHERVYVSDYTLGKGEGMSYNSEFGRHGDSGEVCEQEFHYFGRYQPYGIYIPEQAGAHGMQLVLHGCTANHASVIDQPGMQQVLGEEQNRVLVNPLGRGPYGYYSDASERDVLDVMADVEKNYEIDKDKVFSGGYSMGGYGAYRMAIAYPHRFAGMIAWVGFTGDCFNGTPRKRDRECKSGAIGNVINYVKNLRHVPAALLYAGADELVHTPSHRAMANKFKAQTAPYIYYFHPAAEHFTLGYADDWHKEAAWTADLTRVTHPAQVTFRTMRFLWSPKYGIRHDRAYWISKIRGHESKKWIDIDLTSAACGGVTEVTEEGTTAGPDPVPWEGEYRNLLEYKSVPKKNALNGTLKNVRRLEIDAKEACLAGEQVKYEIESDGKVALLFSDGRSLSLDKGKNKGVIAARR